MHFRSCFKAVLVFAIAALVACSSTSATRQMLLPAFNKAVSPAASSSLLYVTDASTQAYVLSYPGLQLQSTIKGFQQSEGACSDTKGNVWIADYGALKMFRFAHGATKPSATLSLTNYENPVQCAIDAKSGDLAVSSWRGGNGPGYVSIFKGAKGKPNVITSSLFVYAMFLSYDTTGNLYLDGVGQNSAFKYAELAKGKTAFKAIALKQKIGYPGGLQVTGNTVDIGDQMDATIYHTSGTKVVSKTVLSGSTTPSILAFVVNGKSLVVNDYSGDAVEIYPYPAGGAATSSSAYLRDPTGLALSK